MRNRIRTIRKAKNMTLTDVARQCIPPTTAQTIGRLETGMRTLSLDWLERIAKALSVDSSELVTLPGQKSIELTAIYGLNGAYAPKKAQEIVAPVPAGDIIVMRMSDSIGDYRSGDELWMDKLSLDQFHRALNTDILVPRPEGRFIFGRLIGHEGDRIQILPLGAGARQQIINNPKWIGQVKQLIRNFS